MLEVSAPEPFDPGSEDSWAKTLVLKLAWFRAVAMQLTVIYEQLAQSSDHSEVLNGVQFDPKLFILGEVYNSIVGDDENALQVLAMHYGPGGDSTLVREYAAQSKLQILTRLNGHLAQPEIHQELRTRLLETVRIIEISNFSVESDFRSAHAAFRALRDWVNTRTEYEAAMEYSFMLGTTLVSEYWYRSFKSD